MIDNEKGFVLWLSGLPCSGKTTIAKDLIEKRSGSDKIIHLDGDVVRESLCKDLGFSKVDRDENLRRIGAVAGILAQNGISVICTFVSPFRNTRDNIRKTVPNFIEVYVKCPVKACIERDVKGMYALAKAGKIKNFTGLDGPYEKPKHPEIKVNTNTLGLDECTQIIWTYLRENYYECK